MGWAMKIAVMTAKNAPLAVMAMLCACQPPATDNYVDRQSVNDAQKNGPGTPISAPDSEGAIWAQAASGQRLLYGKPGNPPLFALSCLTEDGEPLLQFTRYAAADKGAKAFMALIGNGHVARLKVDATEVGTATLWQGVTRASNDRLEVLTGRNAVEATLPGAGSLRLNASNAPARLIDECRGLNASE